MDSQSTNLPLLILLFLSPTFTLAENWAVLVSGCTSNLGVNYAAQANVYHAWHILRDHGVDPDRIILMAYDDIANASGNPHPGKVFNDPKGLDVYAGVQIDYRGNDVNTTNFKAVLKGDAKTTEGKKVLNSTEEDNVFIYFVDHGDSGIVAFPDGILTVKDLQMTLKAMNAKKMYKKMTFYLEACLSGSMFEGWAKELEEMNIYAVTSSNGTVESWGFYCDVAFNHTGIICNECHDLAPMACIGSDFGRSWMLNVDFLPDLNMQTMGTQTEYMKMGTLFSPVHEFGDKEIKMEKISEFMGKELSDSRRQQRINDPSISTPHNYPAVSISNANEMFLKTRIIRGDQAAVKELELLHMRRQYFDEQMGMLVDRVLPPNARPALRHRMLTENGGRISQMDCHHTVVHHFNRKCFNLAKNQYAMTKSFILNNFCELGLPIERILAAIDEQCANLKITKRIE